MLGIHARGKRLWKSTRTVSSFSKSEIHWSVTALCDTNSNRKSNKTRRMSVQMLLSQKSLTEKGLVLCPTNVPLSRTIMCFVVSLRLPK